MLEAIKIGLDPGMLPLRAIITVSDDLHKWGIKGLRAVQTRIYIDAGIIEK